MLMALWGIYGEWLKQSHTTSCVPPESESSHVGHLVCLTHTLKDSTKTTFHMNISVCRHDQCHGQEVPRLS